MKINIFTISKDKDDVYEQICEEFQKMSSKFAQLNIKNLFNKQIAKAQSTGEKEGKNSYSQTFLPNLKGFNIALNPGSKYIDSLEFAKMIENKGEINFFIGGAYGFEDEFLKKCDVCMSLSPLTFSHKIAKVVLCEQIFRGLSILNNHPYHKE